MVTSDNEVIFLCFPLILLLTLNAKSTMFSSRLKENDLAHALSLQGTASFLVLGSPHSATLGSSFNSRINKHTQLKGVAADAPEWLFSVRSNKEAAR